MKRLLLILTMLTAFYGHAADSVIKATITVTNIPSNGNTLTVYDTRTWTNAVSTPSSQILIGASIGASATNLFNQIASSPYGTVAQLGFSSSNVITLTGACGNALAASATGTWATITHQTNACGGEIIVRVPLAATSNQSRTNVASLLTTGISDYSQTSIGSTSTALANYVSKSEQQTITGNKVFSGNLLTITNATIELYLSNLDIFTNALLRFREGSYLQFDTNVWIVDAAGNMNWAFSNVDATNKVATLLDITNRQTSLKAAVNTWSGANTFSGANTLSGSISGGTYLSPGLTNGTLTNTTFRGQSTFTSDAAFTRANHTALANGNNAGVDFGAETVFAKIKAGPTGAFTINGITGGRNGRELFLYNSTAQTWTFANESGVDGTAANRITTMSGTDVVQAGPSWAVLIYDSETSRWILRNVGFDTTASYTVSGTWTFTGPTKLNGTTSVEASAITLVADNTALTVNGTTQAEAIIVSSDDAVAANRTFLIGPGNIIGQKLRLLWSGTNAGELVDDSASGGATARLSGTWTPTQYDSLSLIYDGTDWIELGRSTN